MGLADDSKLAGAELASTSSAQAQLVMKILDAMSEGLVIQDSTGAIVSCNSAAARILGLTSSQLLGRTSVDPRWRAVHEDGSSFAGDEHPTMVALHTGKPQKGVLMGVHKPDGQLSWIAIDSLPVFAEPSSRPTAAVGVFRDVTRERAERVGIERREALLRATIEGWPQAFVLLDESNDFVLEFNRRFAELFVLEAAVAVKLRGARCAELVASCAGVLADPADLASLLSSDAVVALEPRRLRLTNGSTLDCTVFAAPGSATRNAGRIVVFEDVSDKLRLEHERRTLERRFRETERLESLGALAGGIAHEFNNLLTGILGSAELVLNALPALDPSRRPLERVVDAATRAAALCAEMSASAGGGAIDVRTTHLSDLVHRAVQLMRPSISTRVHIEQRLAGDLPSVRADELQLGRVFENVLLNACEALDPKGGMVRVSTGVAVLSRADLDSLPFAPDLPAGEYAWFEVEDEGVGMDASTQARMFDPFFSTKFVGRGLGLASTASIVRAHKGAFQVDSRPGHGTRVRVLLPAAR